MGVSTESFRGQRVTKELKIQSLQQLNYFSEPRLSIKIDVTRKTKSTNTEATCLKRVIEAEAGASETVLSLRQEDPNLEANRPCVTSPPPKTIEDPKKPKRLNTLAFV
jgi:hypothetical protein